jgi:hypothetical protein
MNKPKVPYLDTVVGALLLGMIGTGGMSFCAALFAVLEGDYVGAGVGFLATGVTLGMLLNALLRG